ncbi:hypothetical protein [Lactococcus protaetiae]|uniref:Uncharacterized protein n=1 Tax=Lactococcus protaetiae TaxID=2592653 RepID=A0A514Z839_9LACT|nr:hypothetical protein [Lactococcus protaetiae]QDK70748.1 hypothetical protein FLP15_05750 [Lactococcus protaetiae]
MNFTAQQLDSIFKASENILRKQSEVLAERLTESYYESGLIDALRYASRYSKEKMLIASKHIDISDKQIDFICDTIQNFTYDTLYTIQRELSRYLEQNNRFSSRIVSQIFKVIEFYFDEPYQPYTRYFNKELDKFNQ